MTDRMSGPRRNEARCFNENSPRPPVPGEETGNFIGRLRPQSPALTPRRSSLGLRTSGTSGDGLAPMGFEPEGCCGTTTMESRSPPAYLGWARDLNSLLQDPLGLDLFKRYIDQEDRSNADQLNFWFACEGLKEHNDSSKILHLIKLIWRRFFCKSQLPIAPEVKIEAKRRIKEGKPDKRIFDPIQLEVERLINETTYPNFLRSDMYLQFVQDCQNADSAGPASSGSSREMSLSCGPPSFLPTLHEDSEFVTGPMSHSVCETPAELRLTKNILMATQQTRAMDLRPKSEACAGLYLRHGTSPYHVPLPRVHLQYSSYNPVSRQDSELQSLSSDARTESDNLSLTDSSVDGMSMSRQRSSRKQYMRNSRAIRESANLNRDPMAHHTVIPRTQRVSRDLTQPQEPEVFAKMLTDKLELVRRDRENQEKLDRHLQEGESLFDDSMDGPPSKALADALREKLLIEDDSDQAILDQHVSRVWSDPTPSRSPGFASPRGGGTHSPERKRAPAGHNYSRSYKQRKEKDVFSTFSADSGNIHDFPEGNDLACAGSVSSLGSHIPKSKSVPSEYADTLHKPDMYLQGHEQRFRRLDNSRRSATKKSMTELTDSGVSVVSDASPVIATKDSRVVNWLNQSDKKSEVKHVRHVKKYGSRSGSLERANRDGWGVPAQPFVADPGMPPLPQPHTATQLEEARRRLMEDDRVRGGSSGSIVGSCSGATSRQRYLASGKQQYDSTMSQSQLGTPSNQSTLRKSRQDIGDFTTVVFNFCDEQFPYRSKIPGQSVTLKQFKEYLPKKGSYRFFFKTECEDLDTKVIQEEITDDADILPLWEGKVMAQVKALE